MDPSFDAVDCWTLSFENSYELQLKHLVPESKQMLLTSEEAPKGSLGQLSRNISAVDAKAHHPVGLHLIESLGAGCSKNQESLAHLDSQ